MAIPFSTLRFDPNATAWGLNVLRYVRRRAEQAFWSPILLDADIKRVSQYGELTGIRDAKQGLGHQREALHRRLAQQPPVIQTPARTSRRTTATIGLDAKWAPIRAVERRPDGEHRLRRDRSGRPADQPDAVLALPGGKARVLPRELRHLRVRPGRRGGRLAVGHERRGPLVRIERQQRQRAAAQALSLAPDRDRRARR